MSSRAAYRRRALFGFSLAVAAASLWGPSGCTGSSGGCGRGAPTEGRPQRDPNRGGSREEATSEEATRGVASRRSARASGPHKKTNLKPLVKKRLREIKKKLGPGFAALSDGPFVVAGDMGEKKLAAHARFSVLQPADAMWKSLFDEKPDKVITVLLFAGQKSYRKWAKKLYGDKNPPYFGYYRSSDRTLVMDIHTGGGTLIHELTHALIVYDFPAVPTWFNEGLASLHEACRIYPTHIRGTLNWRLPGLHTAMRKGGLRSLKELVTKRDFYKNNGALNYAHARYFVMYLQKKKKLVEFYRYFRDTYQETSPNDVKAIEHVMGKPIAQVERDYLNWVRPLRLKTRPR